MTLAPPSLFRERLFCEIEVAVGVLVALGVIGVRTDVRLLGANVRGLFLDESVIEGQKGSRNRCFGTR